VNTSQYDRQQWISVMAKAPAKTLVALSDSLVKTHPFETIRAPEIGLTQVQARMGGTGKSFNLGDTPLTRCVVRTPDGTYGYSYIAGRNKAHALRAAELDALLQLEAYHTQITEAVLIPLKAEQDARRHQKIAQTSKTRVDFFTLVRGED